MNRLQVACALLLAWAWVSGVRAETVFVEAEAFAPSSDGWRVSTGPETAQASGLAVLHGAAGPTDATATHSLTLNTAGHYRIWVRFLSHPTQRGPFDVAATAGGREVASAVFDDGPPRDVTRKQFRAEAFVWKSLEADLPAGEVVLRLSKHDKKNCSSVTRLVDCLLLTDDAALVPDHTRYGPQTYLRVTFGAGYDRPVYLHVFADHFRAPWYAHFAIAGGGVTSGVAPAKGTLLASGERTPWCNITPMLYQGTGALLDCSARYSYANVAPRLVATLEFATAPQDGAIVRTLRVNNQPGGLVVVVPPDLTTAENRARLKTDAEIAEETGKAADAFDWPTFGKVPQRFPFLVDARIEGGANPSDAAVAERERKTLGYMGFVPKKGRVIGGHIWYPRDHSFSSPDIARMQARAAEDAAAFKGEGRSLADLLHCELTDEPTGETASFLADDPASVEAFRAWLRRLGKSPADLLVRDWDSVRPVRETQAQAFPALHYYTQRFRTRSLGDFMTAQRQVLERAYGGKFPVLANFSDGAIYDANFYAQGVDYFELLDTDEAQNAVWGEDWANGASTYQCAAFNIDLMRAATRRRHQPIGHFLIAYAGRLPWDVELKAVGEFARGVKTLESFFYGPSWASHEGGPPWKSSDWYAKPPMWRAHAELAREIGAAEDLLIPAMPARADVAILYSSASDAWTAQGNLAYGFDRMHTWLALTHAQVPVDVVSEAQVEAGLLGSYKVCYLSGPNLTRAAAEKLADWVRDGGTLWLTAGAGARDEFDRPLPTLEQIIPAARARAIDVQPHRTSGHYLDGLKALDEALPTGGKGIEVLSVREALQPHADAEVLCRFKDGSPALVRGRIGKGTVYASGFLPGLAYIKAALVSRAQYVPRRGAAPSTAPSDSPEADRLARSANPWDFPADVRQFLLMPVRSAGITPPVTCDLPLVDAVYMTCDQGILVPLANYTLRPIPRLSLSVQASRQIARVESSRLGRIDFTPRADGRIDLSLPLDATDFVKLYYTTPAK